MTCRGPLGHQAVHVRTPLSSTGRLAVDRRCQLLPLPVIWDAAVSRAIWSQAAGSPLPSCYPVRCSYANFCLVLVFLSFP